MKYFFRLKSRYSTDNRDQISFIQEIPRDVPSLEAVCENMKNFSKSMKEEENRSLRNRFLFGWWISVASKAYRHNKLLKRRI